MSMFTKSTRGKFGIFFVILAILVAISMPTQPNIGAAVAGIILFLVFAALLFSQDYKYSKSSTESLWARWNDCKEAEPQRIRVGRALDGKLVPLEIDIKSRTASFLASGKGKKYHTTLISCTCPDFKERHIPCKHIYKLAIQLGDCDLPEPLYKDASEW